MAIPKDLEEVVSFEELLRFQFVQQEPLIRLLVEKRIVHQGGIHGDG